LTDHRHFASQLSSVHGSLLERIFLTFSSALETSTYLLMLPVTHFNSHLQMHSHYSVNHFPKHVAVYPGVCSLPSLHFYFKQHHCANLLSAIATKLCRSNLFPSAALPVRTWSQQLPLASRCVMKEDNYCLLNNTATLSVLTAKCQTFSSHPPLQGRGS